MFVTYWSCISDLWNNKGADKQKHRSSRAETETKQQKHKSRTTRETHEQRTTGTLKNRETTWLTQYKNKTTKNVPPKIAFSCIVPLRKNWKNEIFSSQDLRVPSVEERSLCTAVELGRALEEAWGATLATLAIRCWKHMKTLVEWLVRRYY